MSERAFDERLELAVLEVHVFGRVDTGLRRIAQWLRSEGAERNDKDIRPLCVYLGKQIDAPFSAQIEQQQGWTALLDNGFQPVRLRDVTHPRETAKIGAGSPNEIRILSVKNTRRGQGHAAATSSSKRTKGNKI